MVGWFVGVLPAWSFRVAVGEGTLRGAGDDVLPFIGVETWYAAAAAAAVVCRFEADDGCEGWDGVGVDMVILLMDYQCGGSSPRQCYHHRMCARGMSITWDLDFDIDCCLQSRTKLLHVKQRLSRACCGNKSSKI